MARNSLSAGSTGSTLRSRRWDALVLGSAIPGLVAGIRLAMAGHRVLVAEEDGAARIPDIQTEPFHLPGVLGGGVLDKVLQTLGIPMIERRRIEPREIAYQVLLPEARIDVGHAELTARELVAWGLAKPEEATELTQELQRAAQRVQAHLMESPLIGRGASRGFGRGSDAGAMGLPSLVSQADGELGAFFESQVIGLAELAGATPGPEACARLLGSALCGGTGSATAQGGLISLLRRRLESLHGEFRTLGCSFQFIELSGHPGIHRIGPGDVWLGRAVIVNAPGPQLAQALRDWGQPVPGFLDGPPASHQRVTLHMRALREIVPEALEPRALLTPSSGSPLEGPIRVALHPSAQGSRFVEIVTSAVVPATDNRETVAAALEADIRQLMPFSEKRLKAAPLAQRPEWDDPSVIADPDPAGAWPAPLSIRSRSREPVVALDRSAVAGLGVEGDLLLGWRAGDAVAQELG